MPNGCESCAGEGNQSFDIATSFAELDIRQFADGRTVFPRVLRPQNICIHKTANFDMASEPIDASCDHLPVVWDDETCKAIRSQWPGSSFFDWDQAANPEPDPDFCGECGPGMVFARELTSQCITHVCVDGEWSPICGGAGGATGPDVAQVCYDVSDWGFPASYGGGSGLWDTYGQDPAGDTVCSGGLSSFAPESAQFACWGDFGGDPGPDDGWNSLGWTADTINNDPNVLSATGSPNASHPCSRPAFRLDPGIPAGAAGPICWEINFTQTSGTTRVAAYDLVSGQQLPVTIVNQPAGSTANLENGPNGPQVVMNVSAPGIYKFEFAVPAGVAVENVRFLAWNMGGSNSAPETIITTDITAETPNGSCCLQWANITQLANWMTANDPGNNAWFVAGNQICSTMAPNVSTNYGDLESCDDEASPQVEITNGGTVGGTFSCAALGSCSVFNLGDVSVGEGAQAGDPVNFTGNGIEVQPRCSVTTPHGAGERSGIYTDACQVLDLAGEGDPEDAGFNPDDFPEWWRQPFVNGVTGNETWIVMSDTNGNLDWHHQA